MTRSLTTYSSYRAQPRSKLAAPAKAIYSDARVLFPPRRSHQRAQWSFMRRTRSQTHAQNSRTGPKWCLPPPRAISAVDNASHTPPFLLFPLFKAPGSNLRETPSTRGNKPGGALFSSRVLALPPRRSAPCYIICAALEKPKAMRGSPPPTTLACNPERAQGVRVGASSTFPLARAPVAASAFFHTSRLERCTLNMNVARTNFFMHN